MSCRRTYTKDIRTGRKAPTETKKRDTMTTTRQDIIDQTIIPAIASGDFDQDTTDRIIDAIFNAAPLSTWSLDGTEYVSTAIDTDGFWSIVEETATA